MKLCFTAQRGSSMEETVLMEDPFFLGTQGEKRKLSIVVVA